MMDTRCHRCTIEGWFGLCPDSKWHGKPQPETMQAEAMRRLAVAQAAVETDNWPYAKAILIDLKADLEKYL